MKKNKNLLSKIITGLILLPALLILLVLMTKVPWYASIIILVISYFGIKFLKTKIEIDFRRMITENLSIALTGISAVIIIVFIIYLLVHIILLGKSNLTWTFLTSNPLEGLTQGGIFPAIFGTTLLVIMMSLIGVPIGTITAIYLAEYARENSILTKSIRFAVNTLAGVPAIVFGLFGLGFFIGFVGKNMDNFEHNSRMKKLEVIINQPSSVFAKDGKATANSFKEMLVKNDSVYWDNQIGLTKIFGEMKGEQTRIDKAEFRQFFKQRSRPKWAQPALIWAALTMALLTLPVVIVSVEEAIRTIPRDLREASLALGATKFATILRIVIPGSLSGILTGAILTVSRGAGEVAPILFTGVAYYLPDLPNSLSSQFMHMGYHIYILTTQSTNVELTKPLQYATTLVLLLLTFLLNFTAIFLRSRIRSKMAK